MAISASRIRFSAGRPLPRARWRSNVEFAGVRELGRVGAGYCTQIWPLARTELARHGDRADAIPDPKLRALAEAALAKSANMEGAALFATCAPRPYRAEIVRALVSFQAIYNYLDVLAEQDCVEPAANSARLHEALLVALDPTAEHPRYYEYFACETDGGYLTGLIDRTRAALARLPSFELVAPAARRAAARIVEFQAHNLGVRQGSDSELEDWASELPLADGSLRPWELAAAYGSSLGVHVMIGLAAEDDHESSQIAAIETAYCPWIGALHSLLDSTIDRAEDRRDGQRNLLDYYTSEQVAATRMAWLAARCLSEVGGLHRARRHEAYLTAMAAFYLSAPEATRAQAPAVAHAVLAALSPPAQMARGLLRVARTLTPLAQEGG